MRFVLLALAAFAFVPASAQAATVHSDGQTVRIAAVPGEFNDVSVSVEGVFGLPANIVVRDVSSRPIPTGSCTASWDPAAVTCPAGPARVEADLDDLDDRLVNTAPLAVGVRGGAGDDELRGGELGDDLDGGEGDDSADGGAGPDRIVMRDRRADSAVCGRGKDTVRAEVLDALDLSCEAVDYGPAGKVGKLRAITGGGRFVSIPGQGRARIDRRILKNVLYLIRKYRVRIGDGFARHGHSLRGEHPLGLAVDIYPGPGGSWSKVDKLARWAEPRQNRPRLPFRWVGYNGDWNHGRGHHLHLSWMHSKGRPFRPVRTAWAWKVTGAAASAIPASHLPRATGRPDR